jgi:hypothetical protein
LLMQFIEYFFTCQNLGLLHYCYKNSDESDRLDLNIDSSLKGRGSGEKANLN